MAVGVLLRELLTIGATIDAARGLPVIHVNFLGYDEQSHRRGPASAFAHWSLRGIDRAIRRIGGPHAVAARGYQVWIYSDHGQQRTVSYSETMGKTVEQAVAEIFGLPPAEAPGRTTSSRQPRSSTSVPVGPAARGCKRSCIPAADGKPTSRAGSER